MAALEGLTWPSDIAAPPQVEVSQKHIHMLSESHLRAFTAALFTVFPKGKEREKVLVFERTNRFAGIRLSSNEMGKPSSTRQLNAPHRRDVEAEKPHPRGQKPRTATYTHAELGSCALGGEVRTVVILGKGTGKEEVTGGSLRPAHPQHPTSYVTRAQFPPFGPKSLLVMPRGTSSFR